MLFNVHQSTLLFHLALEYIKYCDIEKKLHWHTAAPETEHFLDCGKTFHVMVDHISVSNEWNST